MDTQEFSTEPDMANMTTAIPTKPPALYLAYNIIMMCTTAWIMFAMGTGTKLEVVKERLKRPIGPVIGLICQCFLFPAMMYGYAHLLSIDEYISVGMVITASTPGGAVSNMFTFWSRGDLDLSVTMTTISTALAIGFMPLNTYIYLRAWLSVGEIPFVDMVVTILVVWAAVLLGMIVGRLVPKAVKWITRIGSVLGFGLILLAGAVQGALFPEVWALDWTVWFGAITMPIIAFLIGFLLPFIFCLERSQRTAIAFEVSLQNISLAITIITVAFPNAVEASHYSQYVILYGTFQIVFGTTICILFQIFFRWQTKSTICHQFARWKQQKHGNPDIQTMTINGETMRETTDDLQKSESFSGMPYTGSSLSLTQKDSQGAGFVPDGQVGSSTQLVRLDSVDSQVQYSPNGFVPVLDSPGAFSNEVSFPTDVEPQTNGIEIFIVDDPEEQQ